MSENINTTKQTIVEDGTELEGTVRSKVPVRVAGAIKGEVAAPTLTVTSTGSVKGQVKVTELRSEGELAGQIDAESVHLSGKVSDQTAIRATTLEVKLGNATTDGKLQVTFGNVDLHVGEKPARAEVRPDRSKAEPEEAKSEAKLEAKPEKGAEGRQQQKGEQKGEQEERKNQPRPEKR